MNAVLEADARCVQDTMVDQVAEYRTRFHRRPSLLLWLSLRRLVRTSFQALIHPFLVLLHLNSQSAAMTLAEVLLGCEEGARELDGYCTAFESKKEVMSRMIAHLEDEEASSRVELAGEASAHNETRRTTETNATLTAKHHSLEADRVELPMSVRATTDLVGRLDIDLTLLEENLASEKASHKKVQPYSLALF